MIVSMDPQERIYEVRNKLTVEGDKIVLKPIKKKIEKYYGIVRVEKHLTVKEIEEKAKELTIKTVS